MRGCARGQDRKTTTKRRTSKVMSRGSEKSSLPQVCTVLFCLCFYVCAVFVCSAYSICMALMQAFPRLPRRLLAKIKGRRKIKRQNTKAKTKTKNQSSIPPFQKRTDISAFDNCQGKSDMGNPLSARHPFLSLFPSLSLSLLTNDAPLLPGRQPFLGVWVPLSTRRLCWCCAE
jgi:hypothetical protein